MLPVESVNYLIAFQLFFPLLNRVNFWCQKPRTLTGTASVPLRLRKPTPALKGEEERWKKTREAEREREVDSRHRGSIAQVWGEGGRGQSGEREVVGGARK